MARRYHSDSSDRSSDSDEKRGNRYGDRKNLDAEKERERRRRRREKERDTNSEHEVERESNRRRETFEDEKHEREGGKKREEKENYIERDRNLGRDFERDDKRGERGQGDDNEENVYRSRKDDRGRERKSRDYEWDDEDDERGDKNGERKRSREDNSNEDNDKKENRRREAEDGYQKRDRKQDSHRDVESDRRDRRQRSQHRSEDNDENGRYRGRERRHNEDDSRDNRKEQRRNKERERERRHNKDDDSDRRREERNESKEEDRGFSKKQGDVKAHEDIKVQKPEANSGTGMPMNLGRSGGVYIPPFKLARMLKEIDDKSSVDYQRMTWDALRKSINGLVNKVNATNVKNIIPELFAENLIRGRGLFCRSCMKSQMASPGFTDVFAALVAVVNTKFPEVGDLLLRRITLQYQRAYKRNDKPQLLAAVKFIAHLVNQQVVHELIALELLTSLLEKPTDDSVEVAVGFVTECGFMLQDLSPRGLHGEYISFSVVLCYNLSSLDTSWDFSLTGIFERFRGILHEGEIDKRVQFLIEGLFALRKAKFQGYPAVRPELDLVEQEDQLTHEVSLLDEIDPEIALDVFKPDPLFLENENKYEELKKQILGEESEDEGDSEGESEDEDDDDDDEEESDEEDEEQMKIKDETETNLVNLRRTIYLTIMSSVDFEEAGHKLLKIKLEPGQEMELCIMLLECCSQERTYLRYYGLLGQRFCMINKVHQENFEKCFVQQYSMIHRLETNKLRNVAKFFAHLLGTDALPWHVLAYIRLTEEDTTSSSRIFIKILFQELSEHLGIRLLNDRLSDPTMQDSFESIFPKDNPKNTRFAINFFTSIGLGGITENLREYLKNMPRLIMQQQKPVSESDEDSGSSSSDSDASGSESKSGSSSSDSSDSESETDSDDRRRKKRRRN
ncbi:pre-mRNA-splicing factor CWC22 homolog [Olea europaea subsp. europaea]|uniref:Pre-mRNA-splicing factor CWC22 homolog n=1 Tax=Olea europaea subsp. europaea TaxID=158383 RepID=A0A8S0UBD6_OLEEU|nr:pre-mRNA-splicing factor CWC22 homolog [Olea europaea subsp. europaea]